MRPWRRICEHSVEESIYRIHEKPDPKRVMEFEEVAAHFGYSLGVGAIPVKKFGYTDKHRDGSKQRHEIVHGRFGAEHLLAALPAAGGQDRRQARGAHPQLPDAALAEAGAVQHRKRGPLRAGGGDVHALHVAHPAVSGPGSAPAAARRAGGFPPGRPRNSRASPTTARNPNAARPTPSASWWSGRR